MNIKDNAKRGVISTVTGLGIIAAAIASVFLKDVGWAEAGAAITIGLGLIGFGKK